MGFEGGLDGERWRYFSSWSLFPLMALGLGAVDTEEEVT